MEGAGAGGEPWAPHPGHVPRALPKSACLLLAADSVPHVGVSKDLGVLAVSRRCGCLVALGRIHVLGPQGGVGTAHHLAVGGGSWEDDVVSSFGLEGRTGGLTARFRQSGRANMLLPAGLGLPAPPSLHPPPAPQQGPSGGLGCVTSPLETERLASDLEPLPSPPAECRASKHGKRPPVTSDGPGASLFSEAEALKHCLLKPPSSCSQFLGENPGAQCRVNHTEHHYLPDSQAPFCPDSFPEPLKWQQDTQWHPSRGLPGGGQP